MADNPYARGPKFQSRDLSLMTDEELAPLMKWGKGQGAAPKERDELSYSSPPAVERERDPTLPPTDEGFFSEGAKPAPAAKPAGRSIAAEVLRVIDGDTVLVRLPDGQEKRVRLRGVNADELSVGSPGKGEEAKSALEGMLGKKINLSNIAVDQTGTRWQANVESGKQDASAWLRNSGHGESPLAEGPRGNEWRSIWNRMSIDDKLRFKDLAARRQKVGLLQRQGRLNSNTPGYQEFKEEWNDFVSKYYKPLRTRRRGMDDDGVPDAIRRALEPLLRGTSRGPVPDAPGWEEASKGIDRPSGKGEWVAWEKTLTPKERALWLKLKLAGQKYQTDAPPYQRRQYERQPAYVEWKRLHDKFLNLTTERYRRITRDRPPPVKRRRRRAELSDESAEMLNATV